VQKPSTIYCRHFGLLALSIALALFPASPLIAQEKKPENGKPMTPGDDNSAGPVSTEGAGQAATPFTMSRRARSV